MVEFSAAEDWDNDEYTGSLSDTKVFTPSGSSAKAVGEPVNGSAGHAAPGGNYHSNHCNPSFAENLLFCVSGPGAGSAAHVDQKLEAMKKVIENKFSKMDQRLATIEAGKFFLEARSELQLQLTLPSSLVVETMRPPMRLKHCVEVGTKYF